MMKRFLFVILCLATFPAFAGGPLIVNEDGLASHWVAGEGVTYHPESGTCGPYSNDQMIAMLEEAIDLWGEITFFNMLISGTGGEVGSIDASNMDDVLVLTDDDANASDEINPFVFDDDGQIITDLFGTGAVYALLGFAGAVGFGENGVIVDGESVINCFCLDGNPNDAEDDCAANGMIITEDDLNTTITHEFGHFIGLDHSQVNADLESDCELAVEGDCTALPTMYPLIVDAADQGSLTRDDEVAALTLYGTSTWQNAYCTVAGDLTDSAGNELRCADVQAISEDGDISQTIAAVSGSFAPAEDTDGDGNTDGTGECLSNCGYFTLRGLDPSKSYSIVVKPINPDFTDGSSVGPCAGGQNESIVEEEIGLIEGCAGGELENLGTIQTQSSGGSDGSDDEAAGEDEESSAESCADGDNFDNCDPLIGCSLEKRNGKRAAVLPTTGLFLIFVFGLGLLRSSEKRFFTLPK